MREQRSSKVALTVVGIFAASAVGCTAAPGFRAPPNYDTRTAGLRKVVMLPPRVKMYSLSAGGVPEEVPEWTAQALRNIKAAISDRIAANPRFTLVAYQDPEHQADSTQATPPSGDDPLVVGSALVESLTAITHGDAAAHGDATSQYDDLPASRLGNGMASEPAEEVGKKGWSLLEDTRLLYAAVSSAIQQHIYGEENRFPAKIEHFDYTLGPSVAALAEPSGADALLFVDAVDSISTGGRVALIVLGALVSGVTGAYVGPPPGVTTVSVALVDGKSGDLLWFNIAANAGDLDLRERDSCEEVIGILFDDFPGRGDTMAYVKGAGDGYGH